MMQVCAHEVHTQDVDNCVCRLTVVGVPSDCVQVGVAIMKHKLVLRPCGFPLKQIHEVMAIYVSADQRTASQQEVNSLTNTFKCSLLWIHMADETLWSKPLNYLNTLSPVHVSSVWAQNITAALCSCLLVKCDLDFRLHLLWLACGGSAVSLLRALTCPLGLKLHSAAPL